MKRVFNIEKEGNKFRSFSIYGQTDDPLHSMAYPTQCFHEIMEKLMKANNYFGTPQAYIEDEGWELIEVTGKQD